MRRKPVDYSGFSLKKLKEPRFSHFLLLGGWIGYFALYFLTENLIPEERCHLIHSRLDDLIPFCEYFVVFYVSWFGLIVISLARTLFFDVKRFRQLQIYIMITQAAAMLVYILYPNRQDLRPEVFPRENLFTAILGFIYRFDTPTGVFPSLHAAYSIAILSVGLRDDSLSKPVKVLLTLLVVLICASVCFVKQHSVLDVFAALPVCLLGEWLIFWRNRQKM